VAWSISANHGGGYSFRLCPKPKEHSQLTEECFQAHPLRFVADTQWVQHKRDRSTRTAIRAMRTDLGTVPSGSHWTRNPVPACDGYGGGVHWCIGEQFPPPVGPGGAKVKGYRTLPWNIVDRVHVPSELPPGDYVLSFRYDCEQTPQVWNQCADVRLQK
jgi:lytic starch monooxygenase